ncbi:phosphoribosyltransferase-like protein [Ancylomarina subtilis]|nr:hypothetical protein [Ancylomarina subtilis]
MEKIVEEIFQEINDYRVEDNHEIKSENIITWVNQFDEKDREFILSEMLNIFKNRYCTKKEGISFLKQTIDYLTDYFKYDNTNDFLNETEFLSLQENGKSQMKFLELLKKVLKDDYSYDYETRNIKTIKNYLYIDDILCTGNTLFQDINEWLLEDLNGKTRYQVIKDNNSRIVFSYIFLHQKNYFKKIYQLKYKFGSEIGDFLTMIRWVGIDNASNKSFSKCQIVKPIKEHVSENVSEYKDQVVSAVDEYVNGKYETEDDFYRESTVPIKEDFFTSKENRIRFENIVLEKGIEILKNTGNVNNQQMRALGYSLPSHKDFGFGALCFTWRNVPNNTPLVFWYSGGGFIPLFEKHSQVLDFSDIIASLLR